MLTDKHGYPVELEVKILQFVEKSKAHNQKQFNEEIACNFGSTTVPVAQCFWKNSFLRVAHNTTRSTGTWIMLTAKGEEYLTNMTEELEKIKAKQLPITQAKIIAQKQSNEGLNENEE